jgi:hypothetical protein
LRNKEWLKASQADKAGQALRLHPANPAHLSNLNNEPTNRNEANPAHLSNLNNEPTNRNEANPAHLSNLNNEINQ